MARTGQRRAQIVETLAAMLAEPAGTVITTASLAARVMISEAAIYRHFDSKAQIFEALIIGLEQQVAAAITGAETATTATATADPAGPADPFGRIHSLLHRLTAITERTPGLARLLTTSLLAGEDLRLQRRIDDLLDLLESTLQGACSRAVAAGQLAEPERAARARLLMAMLLGLWIQFVRSDFRSHPSAELDAQLAVLLRA